MLRAWQVHVTTRATSALQPERDGGSIVADTLVAMYNPQLARADLAGANEIERHTLAW